MENMHNDVKMLTEIFQVRAIGMASPELLQLVENCPTGAETLIARILNIITDKGGVMIFFLNQTPFKLVA